MKKNLMIHSDRTDNKRTTSKRIVSALCIAGAIAVTGLGTACTTGTTGTTTDASVDAGTAESTTDSSAATATDNTAAAATDTANSTDSAGTTGSDTTAASADTATGISLEDAKAIALADAGVAATDVTYTAEGQDIDDGTAVYEVDFYTSTTEYDYEIRISDGSILSKSTEAFSAGSSDAANTSSDSCISADEAKSIALNKAGLTASDVTFRKAMMERDDGIMVYEIEFYQGRTEYECTINATTGAILEYSTDND